MNKVCKTCGGYDICIIGHAGRTTECPEWRPKWIPVSERLPEVAGMPVLMVATNRYKQQKIVKGFSGYDYPGEFLTNEKEYDSCWHVWKVTHWMPLPEPPKED